MAGRTTRNKIRYHAQQAAKDCDSIQVHLKTVTELSEGRNEVINEHMPNMVTIVEGLKQMLTLFRQEL